MQISTLLIVINIKSYPCLVDVNEVIVAKILDSNWNKFVIYKFYTTVRCFHARDQSSTCTTYGKCMLKSIMAALTPKLQAWKNCALDAYRTRLSAQNLWNALDSGAHILFFFLSLHLFTV